MIIIAGNDVRAHFRNAALHSADTDSPDILIVING